MGAVLHHDVAFSGGFEDVIAANDVGVMKALQDVYFVVEHFHIGAAVLFQFDHFNRVFFVAVFFLPLIHLAAVPRPDLLVCVIEVWSDSLLVLVDCYR